MLARIFSLYLQKYTSCSNAENSADIQKNSFVELHSDKTRHRALKTTFTKSISRRNIYRRLMIDLGVTNRSRLDLICSPELWVFNNSRLPENFSMFSQYRIIFYSIMRRNITKRYYFQSTRKPKWSILCVLDFTSTFFGRRGDNSGLSLQVFGICCIWHHPVGPW